jgi:Caspase domain/Tetratricopeptide repeat
MGYHAIVGDGALRMKMINRLFSAAAINPRLVILLGMVLLAATGARSAFAQQNEARVALVIGNAAYPDAEAALKDPVGDARALADELRRDGFEVDVGENLTKEAMRSAIDRFYGKVKSGSVALLFFSGFGVQSDRQTYMIPVNAQIWVESDVRRDGYSLDSVLSELNSKGARVKIAILDASRRNPFERRFRSVATGLAPVAAPKGTAVMYAAAPGAVARDGERQWFASELLKEIRTPGKVEEVFNRTLVAVSRASKGDQVPWFSSSLVEDFSFVRSSTTSVVDRPPRDPEEDVRRDYESAERIGTRKAWEDFVDRHPSGRYADRARDEIARLDRVARERPPTSTTTSTPTSKATTSTAALDDPAIKELDRRIQANPGDGAAYYKRGQLFAQHGDFSRAVKDFDEVLRLNPKDAEALNNRCWARAVSGEFAPALRDCDEALQIRPRYLDALDSRGFVNLKMGQTKNAITDYDAALRINPKHASSLYGRGLAKRRSGNVSGGDGDIAAAKLIQPDIAEEFASYGLR